MCPPAVQQCIWMQPKRRTRLKCLQWCGPTFWFGWDMRMCCVYRLWTELVCSCWKVPLIGLKPGHFLLAAAAAAAADSANGALGTSLSAAYYLHKQADFLVEISTGFGGDPRSVQRWGHAVSFHWSAHFSGSVPFCCDKSLVKIWIFVYVYMKTKCLNWKSIDKVWMVKYSRLTVAMVAVTVTDYSSD